MPQDRQPRFPPVRTQRPVQQTIKSVLRHLAAALALWALLAPAGRAAEEAVAPPVTLCPAHPVVAPLPDRPRVGLVLSGGGARGAAHVGVLKVIEEYGIPVDLVVGTSMGGIIGALYASGMPVSDLEKLVTDTRWPEVLSDAPPRNSLSLRRKAEDRAFATGGRIGLRSDGFHLPVGAREGQNVRLLLRGLTRSVADEPCFARLPVPFAAVATDAQTGESVTLERGDLVTALRASMAIPGYFSPVDMNGHLLVDGGVANNMPVSVARAMGADVVIAIDITSPLATREQLRNVLNVATQMMTILARRGADHERSNLRGNDVLVRPELGSIGTLDFSRLRQALAAGEKAARDTLVNSPLRDKAAGGTPAQRAGESWQQARQPVELRAIQVDTETAIPEIQILDSLGLQAGDTVDARDISRAIGRVQGLDYFSVVDYRLDSNATLHLQPAARDWGPNYLQFGLGLYNNFDGIDRYELGASYTATAINGFTGQFFAQVLLGDTQRLYAEFYQAMSQRGQHFFVAPWALYERGSFDFYSGPDPVARLRNGRDELGIDLGFTRRFAEWRVGIARGIRRVDPLIFNGPLPEFRSDVGYWRANGFLDTFDHRDFPTDGSLLRLNAEAGRKGLGADANYELGTIQFDQAWSIGRFSLEAGTTLKSQNLDAGMTLQPMQLGGVLQMSAFAPGELSGDHAGMLRVQLRRPLNELRWLRLHAGVALEYGGAWFGNFNDIDQQDLWPVAAAFVGLHTPLGPLWLTAGLSENERRAVQMQLGTRF